ncbi:MAG: hypothetical protein ABI599_13540 [Flavobacteriales bacterium]
MKKFLTILACAAFIGTVNAQDSIQSSAASIAPQPAEKAHVCSASCTTMAHAYVHGEKGHICTEACKATAAAGSKAACCAGKAQTAACCSGHGKAEASAEATKEHSCTAACKDGKHSYAHGEKGHACANAEAQPH